MKVKKKKRKQFDKQKRTTQLRRAKKEEISDTLRFFGFSRKVADD